MGKFIILIRALLVLIHCLISQCKPGFPILNFRFVFYDAYADRHVIVPRRFAELKLRHFLTERLNYLRRLFLI